MFDAKNAHYGQPNDTVNNEARRFRDVTIIGRDKDGTVQLWSTGSQRDAEALLREAAPGVLEPAD